MNYLDPADNKKLAAYLGRVDMATGAAIKEHSSWSAVNSKPRRLRSTITTSVPKTPSTSSTAEWPTSRAVSTR